MNIISTTGLDHLRGLNYIMNLLLLFLIIISKLVLCKYKMLIVNLLLSKLLSNK